MLPCRPVVSLPVAAHLHMLSLKLAQQGWREAMRVWELMRTSSSMFGVQSVAGDTSSYSAHLSSAE